MGEGDDVSSGCRQSFDQISLNSIEQLERIASVKMGPGSSVLLRRGWAIMLLHHDNGEFLPNLVALCRMVF